MHIRFLRALPIMCLLCMSLTISRTSSGGHTIWPQSVYATAYCSEGERSQGVHWYTVHKASASVRSNMFNDMGDYHEGWYQVGAYVDGVSRGESNYYSGKTRAVAEKEVLYQLSPGEVSGNGTASAYIYGVGCVDNAYDRSNFDDAY